MPSPRQDLLAQKRKLEQQIAHIDTCLTMFRSYAVVSRFHFIERVFDDYQRAYDYVADNNKHLDRSHDKWYRQLLCLVPYKWTDVTDEEDAEFVYPDIWQKHDEYGWHIADSVDAVDMESPFSDDDYQLD